MNSVLNDLKNLQEIDDRISGDQKVLADGAARLAGAEARFNDFARRLDGLKAERETMNARHRELEALIADWSVKKENNAARQLAVKSENEYAALLKEADFLNANIGRAEDEALELLDKLEKRELEIKNQNALLEEEAGLWARVKAETEQALGTARGRLAALEARRLSLAAALPSLAARQYEDLLKRKGGRAVAPAVEGMCLACRLSFPPQIYNELQRNEKIIACPNCGRIIYWRDNPDFRDEAGAAGPA